VYDPDGHTNEFYCGIEQVGWNDLSKPRAIYYRGFRQEPPLPQMAENAEVVEALHEKGVDIFGGYRYEEQLPATHDVEGVLLPRPFKITKIGPVHLFVEDVDTAEAFYTQTLGFTTTEESRYHGARVSSCARAASITAWRCSRKNCGIPWDLARIRRVNPLGSKWAAISNSARPSRS